MHGRGPIGVYVNKIELCVKKNTKQEKFDTDTGANINLRRIAPRY